ncbi:hypothetical protein FBR01_17925 [Anaerolineae bacterium CFX8]|nr:hypothetical protein [Anaerolineae bacterium CFX8]
MTTQASILQPADQLLRRVLIGNSIFSMSAGVLMLAFATPIADFMGVATALPSILIGVGLLPFAGGVYYIASRPRIDSSQAKGVMALDLAWVLGSGILLLTDAFSLTSSGRTVIAIVAIVVLDFAIGQWLGLRRLRGLQG